MCASPVTVCVGLCPRYEQSMFANVRYRWLCGSAKGCDNQQQRRKPNMSAAVACLLLGPVSQSLIEKESASPPASCEGCSTDWRVRYCTAACGVNM